MFLMQVIHIHTQKLKKVRIITAIAMQLKTELMDNINAISENVNMN